MFTEVCLGFLSLAGKSLDSLALLLYQSCLTISDIYDKVGLVSLSLTLEQISYHCLYTRWQIKNCSFSWWVREEI